MAMNGTTEAFVFATGNQETLTKVRTLMFWNSIIYLTTGFVLVYALNGDIRGLIFANCGNMGLRAASSLYLSSQQDKESPGCLAFILSVFKSKIFLGLLALGSCACVVLSYGLNMI